MSCCWEVFLELVKNLWNLVLDISLAVICNKIYFSLGLSDDSGPHSMVGDPGGQIKGNSLTSPQTYAETLIEGLTVFPLKKLQILILSSNQK